MWTRNGRLPEGVSMIFMIARATSVGSASSGSSAVNPFQGNVGNGCRGTLGVLLGAQLIGGRAGVQEVVGTFGEGAWHNDAGFDAPPGHLTGISHRE